MASSSDDAGERGDVEEDDAEDETGDDSDSLDSGAGIAVGLAVDVAIGVAMDDLAVGVALGLALGAAFGAAQWHRDWADPRPAGARRPPGVGYKRAGGEGAAMERSTFVSRLDDRLRTDDFAEVDASANGLQVGSEEGTVEHAAFAVDAAAETIDRAAGAGADVLVTHHGLVWGGLDRLTGRSYDLLRRLVEAEMALYVSHLPLDAHHELGNAAGLADLLGLAEREPFGEMGSEHVGVRGVAAEPIDAGAMQERLAAELDHGDGSVRRLPFGPDRIEDVAIVTGSGADWLAEAADAGADAFVTGEGKQQVYHEAKEAGVTVFLAGHYATETFGVRALQSLAREWGMETTFVEAPTGL